MTLNLRMQFQLVQCIRDFFRTREFIDVLTPPMVENPGMEPHIHPFKVVSAHPNFESSAYLQTSPEFCMKELLSLDFKKIFTISYCFRDEPNSRLHRPQFLMLEWYRANEHYSMIEKDTLELIKFCVEKFKKLNLPINERLINAVPKIFTVKELFKKFVRLDLDKIKTAEEFKEWIENNWPSVPLPKELLSWDDYFFLMFLNEIEPKLKEIPIVIIKEYPASMAALSTLKKDDPSVCERFEIYIFGVEIANCYNELTDFEAQKKRFIQQSQLKEDLYNYRLPEPKRFYTTMQKGFPPSAGIALGVERLLMAITGNENAFWPNPEDY